MLYILKKRDMLSYNIYTVLSNQAEITISTTANILTLIPIPN